MSQSTNAPPQPTIGIITALPKEYAAFEMLLENVSPDGSDVLGEIPAANGGRHFVVLALPLSMGNNLAAAEATRLLQHFPTIMSVIMVGIAGGAPYPEKHDEHVRLGDIVISDQVGVIQYDFVKETLAGNRTEIQYRNLPRPPSPTLLRWVRRLEVEELKGKRPWSKFIKQASNGLRISRPPEKLDILASSIDPDQCIPHPKDPKRKRGQPRVFVGPIASANKLLKDPRERDDLRSRFGIKAFEMEGAGIADATWVHETGYLVVRGICDYCDHNKNDVWQGYAAVVAAAYTRALLEFMPVQNLEVKRSVQSVSSQGSGELSELSRLIDQLTDWKKVHQSLQDAFEDITEISDLFDALQVQPSARVHPNHLRKPLFQKWIMFFNKLEEFSLNLGQLQLHLGTNHYRTIKEVSKEITNLLELSDELPNLGDHLAKLRSSILLMFQVADQQILELAERIGKNWQTIVSK